MAAAWNKAASAPTAFKNSFVTPLIYPYRSHFTNVSPRQASLMTHNENEERDYRGEQCGDNEGKRDEVMCEFAPTFAL